MPRDSTPSDSCFFSRHS